MSKAAAAASTLPPDEKSLPAMTRPRPFAWLLLVTGIVGFAASWWLVIEKLDVLKDPHHTTICDINPWISCGEVMQTWQAELFGFPNMFIGVFAFPVIVATAMALFAGARFNRWYWLGLQTGVTLGFALVCWLWSQALYTIGILCPLCMAVWAMMIPMFVWVTARNIAHGVIPAPARLRRSVGDFAWPVVALLYLGVIASILFRFSNVFFPSTM
ncbi:MULTISPECIES: vitamin K epoxide reductase family protein [Arthrobacter]|uniref:Vitamin K epoxide reductase family protein n=2 Tax=Arthrobacter TaxID=1663 RepID=A0ABU9KFL3_9MICC|nr:vitamin K epoxide reductase family protein [Arthrobacter sp. YJM1]MDP5225670.1 vitamin K epoxide reductase family protein [Arthrobacter sp. YJM1]